MSADMSDEASGHPGRDKLLVLISNRDDHEHLVRVGSRAASQRSAPWIVVWVDTGDTTDQQAFPQLRSIFSLAREMGAETKTLRGPNILQTILPFIEEQNIKTVIVGGGSRFRPWRKPLYEKLVESGLSLEVSVVASPSNLPARQRATATDSAPTSRRDWTGHIFAVTAVALSTLIAIPLELLLTNANLVLVYVIAVVLTGLKHGWRPAITASFLAFLSFDFFLTEPRFTFHVTRQDEVATLVFLFLIALACGPAASRIRRQFILLREANRYSEGHADTGAEVIGSGGFGCALAGCPGSDCRHFRNRMRGRYDAGKSCP